MKRRAFLQRAMSLPAAAGALGMPPKAPSSGRELPQGHYLPGRIENDYSLFLPGEREALQQYPSLIEIESGAVRARVDEKEKTLRVGESIGGWRLVVILPSLNGVATAVFEKHVTHQGMLVYVTKEGEIARIPKRVGELSEIRPRPVNTPHGIKFERPAEYVPGPDIPGEYILNSDEDPSYENVAALGPEFIGWTLVANEETAPQKSLWLEADGTSREFGADPQSLWAPDLTGRLLDPHRLLPSEYLYDYVPGYSKRTLLGGYLPAADIGVWNPRFRLGYEVMAVLPPGQSANPIARVRAMLPSGPAKGHIPANESNAEQPSSAFADHYWNGSAEDFFSALAGVWNKWRHFFEAEMRVQIPDGWLLDAARAGIVLCRCSYRGLEPTYQIGEGAYTKIPVRSHALFPVAHYEFVWAHQLWGLTKDVELYFQHYLDNYILPDGNFLYNTQDQVEAPLNAGVFLENSARAYDYIQDIDALRERLPVLRRMIGFVLTRYEYSQRAFPVEDPRYGLIWGSPEADKGDPRNDHPNSHPYYYQNASWTWRGFTEHARCLDRAGREHGDPKLQEEARKIARLAAEMRSNIERSLKTALARRNPAMKEAKITPFTPFDTDRKPSHLTSYENHRYMMDWWTSDWGDPALDEGHFIHRQIAGEQVLGMNTDGHYPRTSNFMAHGTLAGKIRRDDYRSFLLTLYGILCYAMDGGSRYAPEDALLPGSYPGEGDSYAWSAVVNSELQAALGLRWLLCYEEHDRAVVHLQKAAPKHWFHAGEMIRVEKCPTRFGSITWSTESISGSGTGLRWQVSLSFQTPFPADLIVHIHPPAARALKSTSMGELRRSWVVLPAPLLAGKRTINFQVS
jgi:hypothetical protein